MDQTSETSLEKTTESETGVITGVVVDDPGTPCTPEYARTLTERALQLADELDGTMTEIVRVRAWEPLGYRDPREYVLKEFTQSSRAHRYRLARFAAFAHQLTERLGDEALELQLTERALRQVAPDRDAEVINALESRLADAHGPEEANEAVNETLRAHSRNAPPADEDMWGDEAEPQGRQGGAASASRRDGSEGWGADTDFDSEGFDDEGAQHPVQPAVAPPSKAALAEAARYEEFLRAMRVIAATGGELPGILDNADELEERELVELAQKVGGVAAATEEALNGL
ncbi:hypothetical protein ACIBBE_24875 [Streptomyces sp. NPDC051644]|uniref:hypothetical protein n=1 Tax=Streptomyces sp. NPDC051644 TaxID=3365666 RepID=UPI0037A6CB44